jgi:hypothetical protein
MDKTKEPDRPESAEAGHNEEQQATELQTEGT